MPALRPLRKLVLLAALGSALALPLAGKADDGREDVRRTAGCSGPGTAELRLRSDDGTIRTELELESPYGGARWAVILLHERRIAFRGTVRARSNRSAKLRRSLPDWFGPDTVTARASGPRAVTCRISATLP